MKLFLSAILAMSLTSLAHAGAKDDEILQSIKGIVMESGTRLSATGNLLPSQTLASINKILVKANPVLSEPEVKCLVSYLSDSITTVSTASLYLGDALMVSKVLIANSDNFAKNSESFDLEVSSLFHDSLLAQFDRVQSYLALSHQEVEALAAGASSKCLQR